MKANILPTSGSTNQMKESEFLHVGDPVWWQGDFGHAEPKIAQVEKIEYNCVPFDNSGIQVERLSWRKVRHPQSPEREGDDELIPAVVDLTNGHWAFGWQLNALAIWAKTYEKDEMSPKYQVEIVVPYTFTVEAKDEDEAKYKAFEEFLQFEGPPDYQPSNAAIHEVKRVEPTEKVIHRASGEE